MKTKILILILLCSISLASTWAQRPGIAFERLDANQVDALFWNSVDFGWDLFSNPQYEVPKGSGRHSLFASSLWVGGLDDQGLLRIAGQTYRQSGNDYFSGAYRQGFPQQDGGFYSLPSSYGIWHSVTSVHGHVVFYEEGSPCRAFLHKAGQNTVIPLILPVSYWSMSVAPLADGRMLFYGEDVGSFGTPTLPSVVVDVNGPLNPLMGPILNMEHYSSRGLILPNGKTLLMGQYGTEAFDPATLTSSVVSSTSGGLSGLNVMRHSSGEMFQFGGRLTLQPNIAWSGSGCGQAISKLDVQTGQWVVQAVLPSSRNRCFSTEMPDGRIMIFGGHPTDSSIIAFDINTNQFDTIGNLPHSLEAVWWAKLSSGQFVILDNNGSSPMMFDPATLSFRELRFRAQPPFYAMGSQVHMNSAGSMITYLPNQDMIASERYQKIWKVNKSDIQDFLLVRGTPAVNQDRFKDILSWPAHGITSLGEDANLAPFVDVNGNGLYDPLQEGDYPCIQGDQMLWWVFHDEGMHTETGGSPMGIQVKASAYVFDCEQTNCPDTTLDYTVFLHYDITNKSNRRYSNVRVGHWEDGDIGNEYDDYVGADPSLDLGFTYNADSIDLGPTGYGLHPPALGNVVLTSQGLDGFQYYENDWSQRGNPENASQYYQYLNSLWKDGSPVVANGVGYDPNSTLPPTLYHYPGDPGFCGGAGSGWHDTGVPFDRRSISISRIGDLWPGETESIEYAIVWIRDMQGDNLDAVCALKAAVPNIKQFWNAIPDPCLSRIVSNERPSSDGFALTVFPNPAKGLVHFTAPRPLVSGSYQVIDLHGKTVIEGQIINGCDTGEVLLGGLTPGLYFLKIQDRKGSAAVKLLVED